MQGSFFLCWILQRLSKLSRLSHIREMGARFPLEMLAFPFSLGWIEIVGSWLVTDILNAFPELIQKDKAGNESLITEVKLFWTGYTICKVLWIPTAWMMCCNLLALDVTANWKTRNGSKISLSLSSKSGLGPKGHAGWVWTEYCTRSVMKSSGLSLRISAYFCPCRHFMLPTSAKCTFRERVQSVMN